MRHLRLPIFQMTWGEKDGKFGLMYPSELEYDSQDFTFVIPIPVGYINSRPRLDRLQSQLLKTEFYFPIEVAGEYIEVTGAVKIQEDLFDSDSENSITFITPNGLTAEFIIDLFMLKSIFRIKGINRLKMSQYIGNYKKPIFEECLFIPIIIRHANTLNDFYLKNKGIFVGYTKDFGLFDDDNNSNNR